MRICQVTSMHEWDDDRIYQRACLGLTRKGLEVHLIAPRPNEGLPQDSSVHFHWISPRSGWRRRLYSSREAIDKAIQINADIYHFHDPDLLPFALRIKKKLPKSRVIYDIHENYAGRFENWGLPEWLGKIFRLYESHIIKKLDGYTVVSESMNDLFEAPSTPSMVIRNTTDTSRLMEINVKPSNRFEQKTIYTSGTNSHARNCLQAVQSMKHIPSDLNYRMMFVGKYQNDIDQELIAQAKSDGTTDKLELAGMLPWVENFERTARAYCGCVFYEDNPNNRVGIPNRLFEYMYCGIPVVATDFPELRKVIDKAKCGVLVDTEDPKAIADAFTHLLTHPDEAHRMGVNGRDAIQTEYGYHIDLERMIQFYEKLLNT